MGRMIKCFDHYRNIHEIPSEKFIKRVGAYGILQKGEQILLVQDKWAHLWQLPGGGVQKGENVKEALTREFKEETGLSIQIDKLLTIPEDYFYAEDRNEAWHSFRYIYIVKNPIGIIHILDNKQDAVQVQFMSLDKLNIKNTIPKIYTLIKSL